MHKHMYVSSGIWLSKVMRITKGGSDTSFRHIPNHAKTITRNSESAGSQS